MWADVNSQDLTTLEQDMMQLALSNCCAAKAGWPCLLLSVCVNPADTETGCYVTECDIAACSITLSNCCTTPAGSFCRLHKLNDHSITHNTM